MLKSKDPTTARAHSARDLRHKRGIALTEFALILPIILIMVLATIDIGLLTQSHLIISNVAREGGSIASRQDAINNGIISMLQASARPLDLTAANGRIYITRITAGQSAGQSAPRITATVTGGTLGFATKMGAGTPNLGLTQAVYDHLVYKPANGAADMQYVTVVEVYYKYRPITPISNFIPGLMTSDGGGTIVGSKAVF
jgi:Flp pilus assembly protein TadG